MRLPSLTHPFWGGVLMTLLAVWIYSPTLTQPFVQDDWRLIHFFVFAESPMRVITEFVKGGSFFYRPLSMLYHYAVYLLAGPNPLVFHLLLIAWNIAAACAILHAARIFGCSRAAGALAGAVWLGSVYLLQDTTLWMVGMNEPACLIFCLFSLCAWWTGKPFACGGWMALALLTKESAAYLPVTVGLYAGWMFLTQRIYTRARLWAWITSLSPLILVGALYNIFQLARGLEIPTENHPYAVSLEPAEQSAAWGAYLAWMLQNLFPWISTDLSLQKSLTTSFETHSWLIWSAICTALCLLLGACRSADRREEPAGPSPLPRSPRQFLLFWSIASLLPFVIIPDHPYRYYLIHVLVPLLLLTASFCRTVCRNQTLRRIVWAGACLVSCIVVVGNTVRFHRLYRTGKDRAQTRGVNALITKGTESRIIMRDLPALVPDPDPDHALVFLNTNLMGVLVHHGPEVRYGRQGLPIFTGKQVRKDGADWIAYWGNREIRFASTDISFFAIQDGHLVRVPPPKTS